jgi:hypothetical protein
MQQFNCSQTSKWSYAPYKLNVERAMGIEQIRMNQTKALPPAFQSNWSQMESNHLSVSVNHVDYFRLPVIRAQAQSRDALRSGFGEVTSMPLGQASPREGPGCRSSAGPFIMATD